MIRTHLPGQKFIMLEASTRYEAYRKALNELKIVFPDEKDYLKHKKLINPFPITQDEYYQNEAIETSLDVPSRRIKC